MATTDEAPFVGIEITDDRQILFRERGLDVEGIFRSIYEFFGGTDTDAIMDSLVSYWQTYSIIAYILSALFIIGTIYASIKKSKLGDAETEQIRNAERIWYEKNGDVVADTRWKDIEHHITTNNPNDWRQAIIEADIMLEEALKSAGFAGNTIGEMLKGAGPGSIKTLDDAWEAHKIRNRIAHSGSDFILTQKIANDTILRFRRVFDEFGMF